MFPRNQQRKTTPKFRAHIPYKTFHFFFVMKAVKKINKVWMLDRKSQKQAHVLPCGGGENSARVKLDLKTYIEAQRKKLRAECSVTTVRTALRHASAHLKTLTARHQLREKRRLTRTIECLKRRLHALSTKTYTTEFDALVAPYLEAARQMEEVAAAAPESKKTTTRSPPRKRLASASTNVLSEGRAFKHPKSLSTNTSNYDEHALRDELAMVLEKDAPPLYVVEGDICGTCNVAMVVMSTEALFGCPQCGHTRPYLQATSSRIPYGEEVEFASFSYKRKNHFQEWLNAIQAKENTEVPNTVIQDVMYHLYHKSGIRSVSQITQASVRHTLKQLGMRKQYDHTMQIYVSITGKQPPRFSTFQEEQLRIMFESIQGPFQKHCPPDRKNFLSYSYCLYKFCELVGYDHFLQYFMLLKGVEKLRKQDAIFKKICEEMDWQFIPSYKEKEGWVHDAPVGETIDGIISKALHKP